jgi:hypothetical protein
MTPGERHQMIFFFKLDAQGHMHRFWWMFVLTVFLAVCVWVPGVVVASAIIAATYTAIHLSLFLITLCRIARLRAGKDWR